MGHVFRGFELHVFRDRAWGETPGVDHKPFSVFAFRVYAFGLVLAYGVGREL